MKLFHICYKCNDTRDDLAARRKAKAKNSILYGLSNEMLNDLDDQYEDHEYTEQNGICDHDADIEPAEYSKDTLRHIKQMQKAEQLILNTGLIDYALHMNSEQPSLLIPDGNAHYWQTILNQKKESILSDCQKQAAQNKQKKSTAIT